jgi:hypothetical protein
MNIDIKKITNQLADAIVGSGKALTDIPFTTISTFLSKNGIPNHLHSSIVANLETIFKDKMQTSKPIKEDKPVRAISGPIIVNGKDIQTKEVVKREPNKDLFGEIKKIT